MNFTIQGILTPIIDFWRKRTKKFKIIFVSSVAAVVLLAFAVALLINSSGYVVLYSGLSTSEAGQIVSRLSEMGVTAKIESGGTVLVPKEQEAKLKMTLSSEGYPQSALNYDIFSQHANFTTTDFEKRKYLLFQLQNRLQDSIKTIKGVKNAIVTISIPEDGSFVLKEDKVVPSASVVLDLEGSTELSSQQIRGIEQLVAKSVPNLEGKNVAIVNTLGIMLNNKFSEETQGTYTRLDLEKSISSEIENKIIKLMVPIFGSDSIRVAVNTTVDINKKVSEQTTYTPVVGTSGLVSRQDVNLTNTTGTGNGTGGIPGTAANTGVTTYPSNDLTKNANLGSGSYSTQYLNNELKEQTSRDGYEIKDISVAIVVGNKTLTNEEILQYRQLAASASGVSVEKISLSNAQFAKSSSSNSAQSAADAQSKTNLMYILIAAGAAGLIITLLSLRVVMKKRKTKGKKGKKGKVSEENEEDFVTLNVSNLQGKPVMMEHQDIPGEIVLNETREQGFKRQIRDFSSANPDIVAQLLRTWIKEDEDNE